MAVTRIADVIIPEVFDPYVIQRSMELSALFSSGIVENTSDFDALANSGGKLIHMPYWNDLVGEAQVLSDSIPLDTKKITSSKDVARLHARGDAWAVNDLAHLLAGDDPMRAIGDLVAAYWAREFQRALLAELEGVFASSTMADNLLDITGETGDAATINGNTFIDATQLLGDAKGQLTGVLMHAATEAYVAKQHLIEYVQEAGESDRVPMYMGKRVVVDDGIPFDTASSETTTYLFGPGAIGFGNGDGLGATPTTEVDRDSLAGDDILINRRVFILHPRGIRWTEGSVSGDFPTNSELADGDNWERVYEPKAIRVVAFKHKVADREAGGVEG